MPGAWVHPGLPLRVPAEAPALGSARQASGEAHPGLPPVLPVLVPEMPVLRPAQRLGWRPRPLG